MKTPAQILRDAAEVIRTRGWATEVLETPDGRVCTNGAICLAAEGRIGYGLTAGQIAAQSALKMFLGEYSIALWNDDKARSAEEVITALESAAASLEAAP